MRGEYLVVYLFGIWIGLILGLTIGRVIYLKWLGRVWSGEVPSEEWKKEDQ